MELVERGPVEAVVIDVLDREIQRYSSYSCRSPQNSLPRSVSTRRSLTSCSSNNGSSRSLSKSDARAACGRRAWQAYLGIGFDKDLLLVEA